VLDLLPVESLRGKPVGIVAMGYTLHHYLGVEQPLRGVLAWFGAPTAPTAVHLTAGDFADGAASEQAAIALDELLATLVALAERRAAAPLGPAPLAARHM
jgi:FMN reductase